MRRDRFDFANSRGRWISALGAITLSLGLGAALATGQAESLLDGFGAPFLLTVLGPKGSFVRVAAAIVLLGYPFLYGLSLLAEGWSHSRGVLWLGRRVRGSFCLLWSTLGAGVLNLHAIEQSGNPFAFAGAALVLLLGGISVRWLERHPNTTMKPFARALPALLLFVAALVIAIAGLVRGVQLSPFQWWSATLVVSGAGFLLIGSMKDLIAQAQAAPRQLVSRDALERVLRHP